MREQLELQIYGEDKQQIVTDLELAASEDQVWSRYVLMETEQLNIYARNKRYTSALQTFQIELKHTPVTTIDTILQQISVLLMMILTCCLCLSCCSIVMRQRCKFRRQVTDDEADRVEVDADGNVIDA